jgi:very-short-patch-repair endonuclease
LAKADSQFEQHVMTALVERNIKVYSQYPCCGFFIDIVAVQEDRRIAVECDGEWIHLDEQGQLRIEDLERQEVLERAGWEVLRIPYRSWREDRGAQITRIVNALQRRPEPDPDGGDPGGPPNDPQLSDHGTPPAVGPKLAVDNVELAVIEAVRAGATDTEQVFRLARARLGHSRLGAKIRASLEEAVQSLVRKDVLRMEEDELFFRNSAMRNSNYEVPAPPRGHAYRRRSRYAYRRW